MFTANVSLVWAIVGLAALAAPVGAGEPGTGVEVVAKVDDVIITRDDVKLERRLLAIADPELALNNRQLLDHLIDRVLWHRYIAKQGLRPSGADIQRAIQGLDARLREQGSTYQKALDELRLTPEEDASNLSFQLAMERLGKAILAELRDDEVRAEFDARPERYDGSRIRVSEILVDTRDFAHHPEKLAKARERTEKMHEWLVQGKDFDLLARNYSEGPAGAAGGELGWFFRNGDPVDEPPAAPPAWPFEAWMRRPRALEIPREPPEREAGPVVSGIGPPRRIRAKRLDELLVAGAWGLKPGAFSKPIQSARGWHILKVTEREGAYFTFLGARAAVANALARRRIEAILNELRAKAKIEIYLQAP